MAVSAANRSGRSPQLAYSELQEKTRDEGRRRRKAAKIVSIICHFLGRDDLEGLRVLDAGSSTGFLTDVLRAAGGEVLGIDIDMPGLAFAQRQFGCTAHFACADGAAMPLPDCSVDVVVFNQVYEHVVDADAVLAEIRRVLKPNGVSFFGFGNKYQVVEPHYRLPFLSWVPARLADRYVALSGRADDYYERFRSRRRLVEMCEPLRLWDYTYAVLGDPLRFEATDVVPKFLSRAPSALWRILGPILPTFLWIGTPGDRAPAGPPVRTPPTLINPSVDFA